VTDLDRLASLAEAATPGPWMWEDGHEMLGSEWVGDETLRYRLLTARGRFVLEHVQTWQIRDAEADFIAAANPAVVLALVGRLRELETALSDEIAMAEQSVKTLRDLHKNWRYIIEEQVEGEPLIENILYWLIEDVSLEMAREALAALDVDPPPTEETDTGGERNARPCESA
jgi:hypothetical protein